MNVSINYGYLIFGGIMKKIQILGGGCAKCGVLYKNTEEAVKNLGIEAEIEKVTDFKVIMGMGIMTTPALVVDGKVKSSGKVLSVDECAKMIE